MAYVHIKSDEQRSYEAGVLNSFKDPRAATSADRDAAEVVARRTQEAISELNRMEAKHQ